MGRIVVTEFISLDGVIEDPGGSEDYEYGGWSFEIPRSGEGDKFKVDELEESEALLLGRVTYEGFAEAWPQRSGDPFSDKFNAMPKYVVSTTLKQADWNNSTILKKFPQDVIELKKKTNGNLYVHGSAKLVQELLHEDLIDELHLMVYPVVLGKGKRLFGEASGKKALKLVKSEPMGEGIVTLTYQLSKE